MLRQFTLGDVTKQSEHRVAIIISQAMSRNRFEDREGALCSLFHYPAVRANFSSLIR